jgi:hypothetical protein
MAHGRFGGSWSRSCCCRRVHVKLFVGHLDLGNLVLPVFLYIPQTTSGLLFSYTQGLAWFGILETGNQLRDYPSKRTLTVVSCWLDAVLLGRKCVDRAARGSSGRNRHHESWRCRGHTAPTPSLSPRRHSHHRGRGHPSTTPRPACTQRPRSPPWILRYALGLIVDVGQGRWPCADDNMAAEAASEGYVYLRLNRSLLILHVRSWMTEGSYSTTCRSNDYYRERVRSRMTEGSYSTV